MMHIAYNDYLSQGKSGIILRRAYTQEISGLQVSWSKKMAMRFLFAPSSLNHMSFGSLCFSKEEPFQRSLGLCIYTLAKLLMLPALAGKWGRHHEAPLQ